MASKNKTQTSDLQVREKKDGFEENKCNPKQLFLKSKAFCEISLKKIYFLIHDLTWVCLSVKQSDLAVLQRDYNKRKKSRTANTFQFNCFCTQTINA